MDKPYGTKELPAMRIVELQGNAPVLGWADNRVVPVNMKRADVRKTWAEIRRVLKKNPGTATAPG